MGLDGKPPDPDITLFTVLLMRLILHFRNTVLKDATIIVVKYSL
jgi:hypothetical protein